MRRLTGIYDGIEYTLIDYADGQVDCPQALLEVFAHPDGSLPTGVELDQVCRLLFGDTFQIWEG
jgi:hypothetical protein